MFDEIEGMCALTSCGVTMFVCFVVVVRMFHCKAPIEV